MAAGDCEAEMEEVTDERTHTLVEEEEDDPPMLSAQSLEALKEFLAEQNRVLAPEDAAAAAALCDGGLGKEVVLLAEDWRMSQFWYDRETAEAVSEEVLCLCDSIDCPSVACLACPTLYAYLKKIAPNLPVQLLEYDKRFEQYGSEFTFYDYNQPEELPSSLKKAYHIVVADPPYLADEIDGLSIKFLTCMRGQVSR